MRKLCPICGKRMGAGKLFRKYGLTAKAIANKLGIKPDQVYALEAGGLLINSLKVAVQTEP